MNYNVTRTFDILELILNKFPRPDALGGKRGREWYTYSTEEYYQKSCHFALGLISLGVLKGDKIITVTFNRPEWNFVDMGIAMVGAVHVPIYPTLNEDEYKYILNDSQAKYLIAGDIKLYKKLLPITKKIPDIIEIYSFEEAPDAHYYEEIIRLGEKNQKKLEKKLTELKNSIHEEDLATIIYTSGTTGIPKGVMLSQKNLVSNFITHSKLDELGYEHKVISFLPLCHILERSMNYHFQYKGMGVYYVGNLGQILSAIKEIKPHMFNTVPRLLERVYDGFIAKGNTFTGLKKAIYFWAINLTRHFEYNKKYSPILTLKIKIADKLVYSKWRAALGGNIVGIVSGGASLSPLIAKTLGMGGLQIVEGYGLTETSPVIAVNNPIKKEIKIGTVGPVLEGSIIKFADDGEILFKGPGVMMGYYNSPELTAEVIDKEGWFHTGDIGTLVEEKYLKITDRKKEIFKLSGGKYIAPQGIENKLKESIYIEQAMVVGANKRFASALISPNISNLTKWCAEHNIPVKSKEGLVKIPDVVELLQREIQQINKTLQEHEEVKRFQMVNSEWSPLTGELSPTLKLRRNVIAKNYKELINKLLSE